MRRRSHFHDQRAEAEVIAGFGGAQLVKHSNGKFELRGGSVEDQRAAREWVETFMPEVEAILPWPLDRRKKQPWLALRDGGDFRTNRIVNHQRLPQIMKTITHPTDF
jgi:hypothetical protein